MKEFEAHQSRTNVGEEPAPLFNNIQCQFLDLYCNELELEEIATLMGVSMFTIEAIVRSIKKRLRVRYLFEAAEAYRKSSGTVRSEIASTPGSMRLQ